MGRLGYSNTPGDGRIGLTGVGALCMQLLGYADTPACQKAIEYLKNRNLDVKWDKAEEWELYGWYYITQAMFHDGSEFSSWNSKFAKAFTENQNSDGSWTPPGDEAGEGKVYGTTFAALTLQVYYRILPTYQEAAVETRPTDEADEEEEEPHRGDLSRGPRRLNPVGPGGAAPPSRARASVQVIGC